MKKNILFIVGSQSAGGAVCRVCECIARCGNSPFVGHCCGLSQMIFCSRKQ